MLMLGGHMKILELYSGTQSISKQFREKGHETLCIELNPIFESEPWNLNQWTMSVLDLEVKKILKEFGQPDVVWASPMCTTYSLAASGAGHRQKINGKIYPKSSKAHLHDAILIHAISIIEELNPTLYYIENPRGGMRNAWFMDKWNEQGRHTVTYCQYGDTRMKPTDIWTNHPNPKFKPACKNGDPCHVSAPRGSRTGTQGLKGNLERSVIPVDLCKHIVDISEELIMRRAHENS